MHNCAPSGVRVCSERTAGNDGCDRRHTISRMIPRSFKKGNGRTLPDFRVSREYSGIISRGWCDFAVTNEEQQPHL